MLTRRSLMGAALTLSAAPGWARQPAGSWAAIRAAAIGEGKVVIYSTLPDASWTTIRAAFHARVPEIALNPVRIATIAELFERYHREVAARDPTADLLLAGDVDQWAALSAGNALRTLSPPHVPQARVFTFAREPQAFYYNRSQMRIEERTDALSAIAELVITQKDRFGGRIAAYDPFRSDFGCAVLWELLKRQGDGFWHSLDRIGPLTQLGLSAPQMLSRTATGEALIALYIPRIFAAADPATSSALVAISPRDGTPVYPRDMGVPAAAGHPNAAAILVDILLSHAGQRIGADSLEHQRIEKGVELLITHDPAFAANRGAFLARLHTSFGR